MLEKCWSMKTISLEYGPSANLIAQVHIMSTFCGLIVFTERIGLYNVHERARCSLELLLAYATEFDIDNESGVYVLFVEIDETSSVIEDSARYRQSILQFQKLLNESCNNIALNNTKKHFMKQKDIFM
jgi:hypothetical protein